MLKLSETFMKLWLVSMCELIFYNKWTITKLIETFQIKLETVESIPEHPDTSFLNHFMMKNHNNKLLILTIPIFPKISWNQENLKHQNQILHITRKTDFSSSLLEWTSLLKTKNCSMELEKFITDFQNCSMKLEKFIMDFQKLFYGIENSP